MLAAFEVLFESGEYEQIMNKWGMDDVAVDADPQHVTAATMPDLTTPAGAQPLGRQIHRCRARTTSHPPVAGGGRHPAGARRGAGHGVPGPNPRFEWDVVGEYLFDPTVLAGLGMSLLLTVVGMVIGSLLGMVLAAGQLSTFGPAPVGGTSTSACSAASRRWCSSSSGTTSRTCCRGCRSASRSGRRSSRGRPTTVITPLTAAIIGLSLHEAAYMAEIIRAGVLAVDRGQRDAAPAMGFTAGRRSPGRAAAGDAGHHPADRQPVHQRCSRARRWSA